MPDTPDWYSLYRDQSVTAPKTETVMPTTLPPDWYEGYSNLPSVPPGVTTAKPASATKAAGAGLAIGAGGLADIVSDPAYNLLIRPLVLAGGTAYDAAAPYLGLPRMTAEQRADLYGQDYDQPGTRLVKSLAAASGTPDPYTLPLSEGGQYLRAATSGAVQGAALGGPNYLLPGAVAGAVGAPAGLGAATLVPEWAKPGTEAAVGALAGLGAGALTQGGIALGSAAADAVRDAAGAVKSTRFGAPATPGGPVTTAQQAKDIAGQYYAVNRAAGNTTLPAQTTNDFIDAIAKEAPSGPAAQATGGGNAIDTLLQKWAPLRDRPLTLEDAQKSYTLLGDLIDKEYGPRGVSSTGRTLIDLQQKLRDLISPPGLAGNDPWTQARLAWSQAMKMDDIERIGTRAQMTEQPSTSIRTQIRNMVNNDARMRGWSPEEKAALTDAADRGSTGNLMHLLAGRLMPYVAGGVGTVHNPVTGILALGASEFVRQPIQQALTNLHLNRLQNAMDLIGQRVPPANPLMPAPASPPPIAPFFTPPAPPAPSPGMAPFYTPLRP